MYMYIVLPFPDMGAFFTMYVCFHSFFYSPTPILPSHFRTPVLAYFFTATPLPLFTPNLPPYTLHEEHVPA